MDWGRAEKVVEEFVALIDAHQEAACDPGQARVAEKLQEQIRMRLPTIAVIGDQVLRNFGAGLQEAHVGYCWQPIRDRSLTLFGYLRDAEERDAILGPVGPRLSASELHTTVWSAAARLYDGEHYRAAVQAAASAVEMQLKAKLDRYDLSGRAGDRASLQARRRRAVETGQRSTTSGHVSLAQPRFAPIASKVSRAAEGRRFAPGTRARRPLGSGGIA
jgi:hypothetical protein